MDEVNVRVAIRPYLPKEIIANDECCMRIASPKQLIMGKDRCFTFDYILSSNTSQKETYEQCVRPLVTSGFDGYNATVFAYGQTGSGKTYTIGVDNVAAQTPDEYGILPRSLQEIFEKIDHDEDKRDFVIKISYVEIYKEEVHDLFDFDSAQRELLIRENEHGNTVISGAIEITCLSVQEVLTYLTRGSAFRQTGSTKMNTHSSRSHAIFTIFIEQRWVEIKGKQMPASKIVIKEIENNKINQEINYICAKFHFVDLAGSERAHKTGNVGHRFLESVYINSGLLAIGNVISALGDVKRKAVHIPYRDSKITRLLKDSLGGNAKTLMICCVSPASTNFEESLNAIKYANRARNIKNKPIINQDAQDLMMSEMQSEIKQLREQLMKHQMTMSVSSVPSVSVNNSSEGDMEKKLKSSLREATHYRLVIVEAHHQFSEAKQYVPPDLLNRINDWQDIVDEFPEASKMNAESIIPDNHSVRYLQDKIKRLESDLKSDVEIFAEKTRETVEVQNKYNELEYDFNKLKKSLVLFEENNHLLKQQLIEKQMKIDEIYKNKDISDSMEDVSLPCNDKEEKIITHKIRSKSVSCYDDKLNIPNEREIHTSPAQFSMDRVLQCFNARSQLVLSRLEESDEVCRPHFSDVDVVRGVGDLEDDLDEETATTTTERIMDTNQFKRGDIRRGTYKLSKPTIIGAAAASKRGEMSSKHDDLDKLIPQVEEHKKQLRKSTIELNQFTSEIQNLSINIRLKEQLIKGLVVSSKSTTEMNKQYETKIKALEHEKTAAVDKITKLQTALEKFESNSLQDKVIIDKQQHELRKQMELAQANLSSLQKKHKDTQKIISITSQNNNKLHSMEVTVDKLKGSQASLMKQLKEQTEAKSKLEREIHRDQQKMSDLQVKHDNQQKVLRIKTDEVSSMQRRLRNHSSSSSTTADEHAKLDDQKRWLDNEIEKALVQRKYYDDLEKDLAKREEICKEKEEISKERDQLMMKKLRSSQHKENLLKCSLSDDMNRLQMQRDLLSNDSTIQDERRLLERSHGLMEIEEAIDGLNAAIEFRNDTIDRKQNIISQSISLDQNNDSLMLRLNSLNPGEIRVLLAKYFDKVITLRESIGSKDLSLSQLEIKTDDQEKNIVVLQESVRQMAIDSERQMTRLQNEHELRTQLLITELAECSDKSISISQRDEIQTKLNRSEKDLLFYRKTCKELKIKIKELMLEKSIKSIDQESGDANGNSKEGCRRIEKALILQQAPIRLSRRDVRRMSDEEITTRMSSLTHDSLDLNHKL